MIERCTTDDSRRERGRREEGKGEEGGGRRRATNIDNAKTLNN